MFTRLRFVASLSLAAILAVGGCVTAETMQQQVRNRAEFDLACPSLRIQDVGASTYGVRGCGQQATYVFAGVQCRPGVPQYHFKAYCTLVLDATRKPEE